MQNYLVIGIELLGALGLLIFGMKMMSESLQKIAGPQLRHVLGKMTTNRFMGMLTGTLVTSAVQSSSATTVMTVSFVSAGLLSLGQAISVIMGANIGTTLTAWIMSLGYSVDLMLVVFPAFFIGMLLMYIKNKRNLSDFIFGVAFMFLSLVMLSTAGKELDLEHNPSVVEFFASFDTKSHLTILAFLLIGTVITCIVQSSAAVMAITILLCSTGVLPIYLGIALVMGENIGTTVTSNLAALSASTQARRAAFAHMFFNVFGVIWILIIFHPFINFVCSLVGFDVTMTKESVDTATFLKNTAKLSVVLATFHTCFNVLNTFILIWFIPQIEKIVCKVIKGKKSDEEDDNEPVRLKYIEGGLMSTPEISVLQAQKEVMVFGERMRRMFGMVISISVEKDDEAYEKTYNRIVKYEDISDKMEIEIAQYLEKVCDSQLSEETMTKIHYLMRAISELESVGDACYNLARIFHRVKDKKESFTESQMSALQEMMKLTDNALAQMIVVLRNRREDTTMKETYRIENEINQLRDQIKSANVVDINDHKYNYYIGTAYIDLVNECERLGDYVVNVVESKFSKM